jgi:hypothetical protein
MRLWSGRCVVLAVQQEAGELDQDGQAVDHDDRHHDDPHAEVAVGVVH